MNLNIEEWKTRRKVKNEDVIFFRDMKGYKVDHPFRNISAYYPKEIQTFLEITYPKIELVDLYYEIEETRESLIIQFRMNVLYFDCNLYLETLQDEQTFDFNPTVQEGLRFLSDVELLSVEPNLLSLYEKMKQFILDYSPNRLQLVTSTYDTILPVWLWDLVYSGESS